jgi:nucleotide-binding universal stress UspA family protein
VFELGNDGPSLLLAAIDGSDTSMRAGAYAAGLARRQHSRLVVLYVRRVSAFIGPGAAEAITGIAESNDALARELRETIEAEAPRLGLDVVFVERSGNPYREIIKLAQELRVDALIIGASTQAGHRIVGSLATHLVRDAKWPIIVVP